MKDYGKIKSFAKPEPKVIDEYSVWVNTGINEINNEDGILYIYNQVRYDKNEYIKMIDDKNETLEAQMTDTQLALVEVYEMML